MAALNPEIIKDTKSLISLYQGNTRFKTAFDRIVANNINAIYKGRPVKLYVEVLANVSSTYKRDYDQVKRISLHDKEGKVGELFKKIKPNDFFLLDAATRAAQQNLNNTSYGDKEVEQINKIEADAKNNKEKREAHQQRLESELSEKQEEEKAEPETKTESEKEQAGEHKAEEVETKPATEQEKKQATPIVPGENPEHKKSYNPASQEEKARVEAILNQPKEEIPKEVFISPTGKVLIKPAKIQEEVPQHILVGPSGEPIRNIRPETEPESQQEISEVIPDIRPEVQFEPSGQPSIPSIPNISRPSGFKQFISSPRASVNNFFRGSASAGKVVATGAGKAVGKMGIQTAVKAGAGAATKFGASVLAGVATGGVGLIIGIAASLPDETKKLFKLIFWIVIGLIAFIVVMFVFQRGEKMNSLLPPYDIPTMDSVGPTPTPKIALTKSGPISVNNGQEITYTINLQFKGNGELTANLNDPLPSQTKLSSCSDNCIDDNGVIKWIINKLTSGSSKNFSLTVQPQVDNIWVQNYAEIGNVTISGGTVLPPILPPAPSDWAAIKKRILEEVNRYPSNIDVYKQASQVTGILWQVLAGIHSVEGSSNPSQSLVSGRAIGSTEPDVPLSSCSKNPGDPALQPGEPVKIGGGCGFASLLDTAIYAGIHLKDKNNGKIPQSFEEFIFALAGYNGWGNTNCNHNTPYANTSSCPPSFSGEDHPHPMNWYDERHATMYIVYCSDGVQCQIPRIYQNPGVMAIVRALSE